MGVGGLPNQALEGQSEAVLPGQIRALPAGITNCVGRFRRTPGATSMYCMAGVYTFAEYGPGTIGTIAERDASAPGHGGLDLSALMFAPWLLGCLGTPRQHPVSAARSGFRRTDKMATPGIA